MRNTSAESATLDPTLSHPTTLRDLTPLDLRKWIGLKTVAELTGFDTRTVQRWIAARKMPAPVRISARRLRWRLGVIVTWMQEQEQKANKAS